jgi:hypothetical protein
MESDTAAASVNGGGEVMAAVDGTPKRLVIADVSCDEAWLAMRLDETVTVSDYA